MALIARDNTPPKATEAQKEYIESLLDEIGMDFDEVVAEVQLKRDIESVNDLFVFEASEVIEYLKELQ